MFLSSILIFICHFIGTKLCGTLEASLQHTVSILLVVLVALDLFGLSDIQPFCVP